MTYTVSTASLEPIVSQEISKVAASTRDKDGNLLYDILKKYASDATRITRLFNDALGNFIGRFYDIASLTNTTLTLTVPDLESAKESSVTSEISNYLINWVIAEWFISKVPDVAKVYAERAGRSMENLSAMLYHRKKVTRS